MSATKQQPISKTQSKMNLDATLRYVTNTDDTDLGNPAYYCQKISQYVSEVIG